MNELKHGYRISVKSKVIFVSLVYAGFYNFFSLLRRCAFFKKVSSQQVLKNRSRLLFV